jgi:hypothetical protein
VKGTITDRYCSMRRVRLAVKARPRGCRLQTTQRRVIDPPLYKRYEATARARPNQKFDVYPNPYGKLRIMGSLYWRSAFRFTSRAS